MAACQAEMMKLTALKSDLELHARYLSDARFKIANILSATLSAQSKQKADPETIAAEIALFQMNEKKVEVQQKYVHNEQRAVQERIEDIAQNIKRGYC